LWRGHGRPEQRAWQPPLWRRRQRPAAGRRGRILPTIRSGRSVRGSRVGKQTNDGECTADEGNRAAEGTLTWLTTEPAADDPAPPLSSNEFVGSKLNESSSLLSADCRVAGRGSLRALTFLVWAGGRKGRFFFVFLSRLSPSCLVWSLHSGAEGRRNTRCSRSHGHQPVATTTERSASKCWPLGVTAWPRHAC
jgi:hypothetical protein